MSISLIFVSRLAYISALNTEFGSFSAVSSVFVIGVQSKLELDPNYTTAAYIRILINAVNDSLFPDAGSTFTPWAGPPPKINAAQSSPYTSLATSLFSPFFAMFGKQWVTRYLWKRGGSAIDKSRYG